ncbi:MAG: hypothetical protein JWM68_3703 [Verrucomicrobiales bacterium]|nr:hypothetical protein [Verrucomicrobiales bacterium]
MQQEKLGDVIRELREKQDLSLRELARQTEISAPFLSDVELGRRYPSDEVLEKIAKKLKVSVENLKQYDHRDSVYELKRMVENNPSLGFAFRTALDEIKEGKLTPEQLAARVTKGKK